MKIKLATATALPHSLHMSTTQQEISELEKIRDEKGKNFARIHEAFNADQPGVTESDWDAANAELEAAKTALLAAKAALITPERRAELDRIAAECDAIEGDLGARQLAAYRRANSGPAFAARCACGGMHDVSADGKSCRDCR